MTSEMQMHGMIPPAMELLSYQSKHNTLVQDADEEGIHGGNWRGYGAVGVGDADSRHQNLLWATPISGLNQQPYNHMHGGSSSSSENHSKLGLSESQDGRHEYMLNSRYHHPQDMLQGIGVSSNSFETGGGNSSLPYSIQLNPSAQVLRDPGSRWQGDFSNNIGGYGYNNNWVSRHQGLGYQTRDGSSQRLALSLSSSYNPSSATDIHMAGQANLLGMEADTRRRSTDPHHVLLGLDGFNRGKQVASLGTGSRSMFSSYGNTLKNSVYLKAAEELLCEFCIVGRESKSHHDGKRKTTMTDSEDCKGKTAVENQELFVGDRYELQRRKVKLVTMLEEVEIRYKNYRSEMHMVIASFESVTAVGSAAPYTSLALKAMSKHFRCLRDAITGQLEFTIKLLGEKESVVPGTSRGETPRLGLIERTLRQQRAYQQLGTLEQHPWRPQRGLPERSVSILRAWLFEHFLHPYPTDGDKHILAKQTGLTRSQVSNWFINARVRLWKPMVEEMYIEELKEEKDRSQENNDEQKPYNEKDADTAATSAKTTKQDKTPFMAAAEPSQAGAGSSISQPQTHNSSAQLENVSLNLQTFQGYKASEGIAIEQSDSININQGSSSSYSMFERNTARSSKNLMTAPSLVTTARIPTADIDPDFSAYSAETLTNTPRRYGASSGVSLTLGLRHSGLSYPLSEPVKYSNNNIYLARQHSEEDHAATQYNILPHGEETQASELLEQDLQQQYRHYVSGNRLLHDFVQAGVLLQGRFWRTRASITMFMGGNAIGCLFAFFQLRAFLYAGLLGEKYPHCIISVHGWYQ